MVDLTAEQNKLLADWRNAKTALETAKETEMELRKRVSAEFFPKPDKGTQRVELPFGWKLKLVHKINYTLAGNDAVNKALDEMANAGNEGTFLAERVVSWKPSLSVREYDTLDPKYKAIINKVLTTSDGAPTLELEEPKVKK